jgi:hypothetical protein
MTSLTMGAGEPEASFVLLVPAAVAEQPAPAQDDSELREQARRRARQAFGSLLRAGVNVDSARVGDASPLQAVDDLLREGGEYAGIILSTFPPDRSRWLPGDLLGRLRRRFGLPVWHVVAASTEALTA